MSEPLVWMPLDGNLRNIGLGTIKRTSSIDPSFYSGGKVGGKSYNLNVRTSYTCSELEGASSFSVCFWVKTLPSSTITINWQDIIGFTDISTSGASGQFRFESGYGNNAYGGCHWHDNATNAIVNGSFTYFQEREVWHHCAVVVAANEYAKSYTDGVLQSTITANLMGGHLSGAFWIGETNNIEGAICDVRIYDTVLSDKEVHDIAQGLALHLPMDMKIDIPDLNDYPGNYNLFTGTGTNSYLSGASGTTNTATVTAGKWYGASGGNGTFGVASDASVPVGSYSWNILNNTSGNRDYGQQGITYAANEEYTVTWWAKGNGTFQLRLWDYTSGAQRFAWTYALSSEWQHYTEHFKSTSTIAGHNCNLIFGVTGKANLYMCGMKVEEGTVATKYMLAESEYATPPTTEYRSIVRDASGYDRNGIIFKESEIVSDSPRYEASTHLIDPTPTANSDTGAYARIPLHMEDHEAITFAWWGKHKAGYGGGWHGIFSTSANASAPTDYNTTTANHRDNAFDVCNTSGTVVRAGANMFVANEWHHYALVYDGAHVLTYRDGTQVTSHALTGALKPFDYIYLNFSKAGSVFRMNDGYWSDFRIYVTALSPEDILELYRTGAVIDDRQRLHTHEFVEAGIEANLVSAFAGGSPNKTNTGQNSCIFDFSNQRDTYCIMTVASAISASQTYYVSCDVEGLADGDSVAFYMGGGRTKCDLVFQNGHVVGTLTGVDVAAGGTLTLDDYLRSSSQQVAVSNFCITEVASEANIEKSAIINAAQFSDDPDQVASIYDSGDIAAADLIER